MSLLIYAVAADLEQFLRHISTLGLPAHRHLKCIESNSYRIQSGCSASLCTDKAYLVYTRFQDSLNRPCNDEIVTMLVAAVSPKTVRKDGGYESGKVRVIEATVVDIQLIQQR